MKGLEEYAAKIQGKQKPAWTAPVWEDFKTGWIVASFDQTFSTTGVVLLMAGKEETWVFQHTTWKPFSELNGFEMAYEKTAALERLFETYKNQCRWDQIVYEMPVVAGHRKESSFLAGYVFAKAGGTAVSIQHSRAVLAGPGTANDKKAGHKALLNYIPSSGDRTWNEHQRDAAINALAYLHDLRRQEHERRD